jgi:DNA-binding transcriptional ArsR family regulator
MAYGNAAFAALSDPTRRRVLERLADGPRAVGEIAEGLPVSRPAVSQHLKVLKDAGLVSDRLGAMRAWLDQFWDVALAAFKAEVERAANDEKEDAP